MSVKVFESVQGSGSEGEAVLYNMTVWGAEKDFIFSGWVAGPLCRWVRVLGGGFWPSGGLRRTLSLVGGSLVHCVGK